jgi:hypothetical protein
MSYIFLSKVQIEIGHIPSVDRSHLTAVNVKLIQPNLFLLQFCSFGYLQLVNIDLNFTLFLAIENEGEIGTVLLINRGHSYVHKSSFY